MSLESDLYTALKAVTTKVFPDTAPPGEATPYIVYTQIGGEAPTFLEKAVPDKENALIQIEYWAATRLETKTKIKAIEQALVTATAFQASPVGAARAMYSDDVGLRGMSQDFTIWATR
jgi:hypothetical protein